MNSIQQKTEAQREYINHLEHRLRALETDFRHLETEAEKSLKKPSAQLADVRKTFDEKRRELRSRLSKAETSAESAWTEMKAGLDAAWTELADSFERVRKELSATKATSKVGASS